jgi:hypothetical protein
MELQTKIGTHVPTCVQCWGSAVWHKSVHSMEIHPLNLVAKPGRATAQVSHLCCPGSSPRQLMRDLWRIKWQWTGFSEYFRFIYQFSFHRLLHTHHLTSGAGTIGQLLTDVPSGLSVIPPQETKRKQIMSNCRDQFFYTIGSRMAVRLSASHADRPLPPGKFLVFIYFGGWVDQRAIVTLKKLCQFKNPMAYSGVEPATFQLVA